MKLFRHFLYLIPLSISLNCLSQTNAGMPLAGDICRHFFASYDAPDNFSYYKFEKKAEGWFVCLFHPDGDSSTGKQLFWDKRNQYYHNLDFPSHDRSDSSAVSEQMMYYAQHYYLTARDIIYYDRNLYYGYDDWNRDVIDSLEAMPPTSDSLLECLANAYSNYCFEYITGLGSKAARDKDPDRRPLADSLPFPESRVKKYISYAQRSVETYKKLYALNNHYRCADYDVRWRMNSEAMTAWDLLPILGYDSLRASFLQAVSFPDSVLQKARQLLQQVKPQGIVFTNGDTTLYPILYLQYKGLRQDVIALDYTMLSLKRNLPYLDHKYHHSLFATKRSVYLDPAFEAILLQPSYENAAKQRIDSFLTLLYISPDSKDLPALDSSLGRLYRYFTPQVYFSIDIPKAKKFYHTNNVTKEILLTIPGTYLFPGDVVQLDIMQKNLMLKHIYFTSPMEQPMFAPYCVMAGEGIWEFGPTPIRPGSR